MIDLAARAPQTALIISPVTPDPNGKGLARRAAWTVKAFAERYRVTLLIAPLGRDPAAEPPASIRGLCEQVEISRQPLAPRPAPFLFAALGAAPIPVWPGVADRALDMFQSPAEWRTLTRARLRAAADAVAARDFDRIHTFRLYATPITWAVLEGRPRSRLSLDLDDLESVARQRFSEVHAARGDARAAALARRAAAIYRRLEDETVPRFDQVAVCSDADAALVRARYGDAAPEIGVAPNVVSAPPSVSEPARGRPFRFLFVGTLNYFPNADALRFFLTDVSDRLDRALGSDAWTLDVVGLGGPDAVAADLRSHPRIRLIEEAPEMPPVYARADALVAPIRAGGGTRIKILEAFAEGRPVIATTIGAEGIDAIDRRHLLIADDADAFASACAELARDDELAASLAGAARRLVIERYAPSAITAGLLGAADAAAADQRVEAAQPAS